MKPPPALPRWPPLSGSGAEGWPRVLCHASDSSVGVSQLPARRFDVSSRDWKPLGSKRWRTLARMCLPRSIRWLPPMVRWKLKDKQRTKSRIDGFFLVKVNFQILGENLTLLQFYPFLAYTFFLFPSGFFFRKEDLFLRSWITDALVQISTDAGQTWPANSVVKTTKTLQRIDAASPRSSRADSAMVTLAGRWSTEFIVLFVCCILMCYIYIYNIHMYHAFRIHI